MLYSKWEKYALLENLNFIYQSPRLSILSKEAKSGATKSYKIVHIPNCVRRPYYLAKKMNPRHLGFSKMHLFFENIAPPWRFLKIGPNAPRFLRCLQILRFFLSDLKGCPFFSSAYTVRYRLWPLPELS